MMIVFVVATSFFTAVMFYKMMAPLLESTDPDALELLDDDMRRLEELVGQKALMMSSLAELEQDLELEKLTVEDYTQLKRRYQRQIIGVMKQLDTLHGGRGWEVKIDEELNARRAGSTKKKKKKKKTTKPKTSTVPVQPTPEPETIHCHECDKVMDRHAKFCSECGATLQPVDVKTLGDVSPSSEQEVTP